MVDPPEFVGRLLHDLLPADQADEIDRAMTRALATGNAIVLTQETDVQGQLQHQRKTIIPMPGDHLVLLIEHLRGEPSGLAHDSVTDD